MKEHIFHDKIMHMHGVAEYMYDRASDYHLNPEEMYSLGLLHDIGYVYGQSDHENHGADLLSGMGLKEEYIFAIRHHGDNPYQVEKQYGAESISNAYLLLLEADMSVEKTGLRVGFQKRIEDIISRYGTAGFSVVAVSYIKEQWIKRNIKPSSLEIISNKTEYYG